MMPNLKDKQSSTRFIASQVYTLLMVFASNQYSGIEFREKLAKEVGVSESTVQIWFKNLRSKFTKNKPEESSERTRNQEQYTLTGVHPSVPSQVQELRPTAPTSSATVFLPQIPDQMDERGSQGCPYTRNTLSSPRLPSPRMQSPQSPLPPNGQDTRRPTGQGPAQPHPGPAPSTETPRTGKINSPSHFIYLFKKIY